ncbi:ATP-binding protein [Saprospiraceae bacterium]|nr:ATP-binding protein [Saprospiraceae bacterium]
MPQLFFVIVFLLCTTAILAQSKMVQELYDKLPECTSTEDSIRIYLDIARAQINADPKTSLSTVMIAKECCSRTADKNLRFRVVFSEATATRNMRNHQDALVLFEQFIEHHKTSGDHNNLHNGYQAAGSLYSREGEFEKAEEYLLKANAYYKGVSDFKDLARNYRALGSMSRRKGDFPKALDYTFDALAIFEEIDSKQNMSNAHNSLGIIYSDYGDKENAAKHFKINYQISFDRGDKNRAANALINLSSVLEDAAESRKYMKEAIVIYNQIGLRTQVAEAEFEIGTNYNKENKVDSALYHLNRSAEQYASLKRTPPPRLKIEKGNVLVKLGQYGKAEKLLDESVQEIDQVNGVSELAHSYGVLSNSYADIGDYEKAYKMRIKQNVYSDSIFQLDQNEAMAEMQTAYKVKEKDLEIQTLEAQSALSRMKIMRRNLIAGFLGLGLLLMGFLLYKIRNKNRKIESQNSIIKESLVEKEALLREIHHRVKNNLQIISSLLNIQSRSITDEKAKEAILIGKNRVHSMSLIHQNLYDKDNLTGILISNYLPKLVEDINNSYRTSSGNINILSDIDPLELDVDTVIPIGLIVNELITNCLKYAFPDNSDGNIHVKLKEINDHLKLSVSDDGVGMSKELEKERVRAFGHKIIKAFKAKLGAEISISGADGTKVELVITKYKKNTTVKDRLRPTG